MLHNATETVDIVMYTNSKKEQQANDNRKEKEMQKMA